MINYHSQFVLNKEKEKNDAKLRFRIRCSNFILNLNLGHRVDIDKWDYKSQRCKSNTIHSQKKTPAHIINRKILLFEDAFEVTKSYFIGLKTIPTKEQFQNIFYKQIGREKLNTLDKSFFDLYEDFIQEESILKQWSNATTIKVKQIKKHLINFDSNIDFNSFTETKFIEYIHYLQNSLGHKNSTILKNISFIKWFLRWGVKKGFNSNSFFEDFHPKLKKNQNKIIFLNPKEFKLFRNVEIPPDKHHLEKVKDIFLFQCFTGLRFSDVSNLKKNDIKENYIEVTTLKTNDNLTIELNKYSRYFIEKYKDYKDYKNRAFPVISNQKMNLYLKEIAKLAGIDDLIRTTYYIGNKRIDDIKPKYKLIGTHCARRTFICNALSLGIPPQVVMKWTGHSEYKTMKPYIDIADETKEIAMTKFDSL